ncbi:MAG: hypothetical protein JW875_06105 [Spirochaetales bacterium]|nr:hypothetical protein [Spirochaetales bacterium]
MKTLNGPKLGINRNSSQGAGKVSSTFHKALSLPLLIVLAILLPCPLHSLGKKDGGNEPSVKVITEMQDRYNALPVTVPAVAMLPTGYTSAIPLEIVSDLEREIYRQMVLKRIAKPVLMNKWLFTTFAKKKADNPFAVFRAISAEQYVVPVQLMCKPYLFKNGDLYGIRLAFYQISEEYYPVETFRLFLSPNDIPRIVTSCLEEFSARKKTPVVTSLKKKILVEDFRIEFRKLIELESGEFEYIVAPFIHQDDVTLRQGDEYFSLLCAYVFSSTEFYASVLAPDFTDIAYTSGISTQNADYIIRGRVQLSDQMCIMYVDLVEAKSGTKVIAIRQPIPNYNLQTLWNTFRKISSYITEKIFTRESFGVVSNISSFGKSFYTKGVFIGWDEVKDYVFPKGVIAIETGSFCKPLDDAKPTLEEEERQKKSKNKVDETVPSVRIFYPFYDAEYRLFVDREGEYVWNLLNK